MTLCFSLSAENDETDNVKFEFILDLNFFKQIEQRRKISDEEESTEPAKPLKRNLMRTTLNSYAKQYGLSTEDTIVLEYFPSVNAPKPGPSIQSRDWINCFAHSSKYMFAGLYDGSVHFTRTSTLSDTTPNKNVTESFEMLMEAHVGAVTGVAAYEHNGRTLLVTAGTDGYVRAWLGTCEPNALELLAELAGVQGSIGSLAMDSGENFVAAGDAAGHVTFWSLADVLAVADAHISASAARNRKRDRSEVEDNEVAQVKCLQSEKRHVGGVTALSWLSADRLASGGQDGVIHIYDLEERDADGGGDDVAVVLSAPVTSLRSQKVVTSISGSPLGGILATGHPDHVVRLWDSAGASEGSKVKGLRAALKGAKEWVASVAWCPVSPHLVAATTYSGSVLVWDTRAPGTPLNTLNVHSDKALACAWLPVVEENGKDSNAVLLLSGGADKTILTHRVSGADTLTE